MIWFYFRCDHCQNDVNGIRFDCVHCPALTYCEKCEQQATLMHSRENQAYQQQQHVFKLIMIPEEEATQFWSFIYILNKNSFFIFLLLNIFHF